MLLSGNGPKCLILNLDVLVRNEAKQPGPEIPEHVKEQKIPWEMPYMTQVATALAQPLQPVLPTGPFPQPPWRPCNTCNSNCFLQNLCRMIEKILTPMRTTTIFCALEIHKNEEIAKRLNCASSACCTASFACCAAAAARRSPSSAARQRSACQRGSQKNTIDKIAIRKVLWIVKLVLKSSQYVSDENKLIHSLQLYASLGFLICCQF